MHASVTRVGMDFNLKDKALAADGRPRDVACTGVGGAATAKYNRDRASIAC